MAAHLSPQGFLTSLDRMIDEVEKNERGTPPTRDDNSRHVIAAAHRRAEVTANAPSPRYAAWTAPASRSGSTSQGVGMVDLAVI